MPEANREMPAITTLLGVAATAWEVHRVQATRSNSAVGAGPANQWHHSSQLIGEFKEADDGLDQRTH